MGRGLHIFPPGENGPVTVPTSPERKALWVSAGRASPDRVWGGRTRQVTSSTNERAHSASPGAQSLSVLEGVALMWAAQFWSPALGAPK